MSPGAMSPGVRSLGTKGKKKVEPVRTVRPYIEMTFQRRRTRTSVSEGPNPHWNEPLSLQVQAPRDDFRPEALLESDFSWGEVEMGGVVVDDSLLTSETAMQDERDRERKIHQRKERNWLGSLAIPFSTIHEQTRIEGHFRVNTPAIMLGYEKNPASTEDGAVLIGIGEEATTETVLHLFITLEPPLVQPSKMKLKVGQNFPHHDCSGTINHPLGCEKYG
ncbi:Coiled-coil and C2 domain-containing protein 2A [Rhizophlyctis rosea]|nr:Coiled-coil and C2 domain-containing protein 2A [Rhizophlyctis rosea]